MAVGVQVWSQTPASNATADSNINYAEGMAPSALNDSNRSLMASVARWNNDNNGTLITSGSSAAFTLVTNQVESALTAGFTVAAQFHIANDASATLAVDGLTAKPLRVYPGVALTGYEMGGGSIHKFTYSTTGTGEWIRQSPPAFTVVNASLASSVTLSTGAFTDGPSVSAGTSGIWYVSGSVAFQTSNAADIVAKLWDGTTSISASYVRNPVNALGSFAITMGGTIVNPTGNLRISGQMVQVGSAGGFLHAVTITTATTGICNITAVRIG